MAPVVGEGHYDSGVSHDSQPDRQGDSESHSSATWAMKWLNENGAALEMRVARKMLVTPSRVEHSGYYRDVNEGSLREFDVHAVFNKNASAAESNFEIHVIVECKASSPPWILFMASESYGSLDWDFENFFESASRDGATVRDLNGFPFAAAFRTSGQPHAYQVAEAAKKNSAPYDAVRQVLDALAGIRAGHLSDGAAVKGHTPRLRVYLPVVVTTSPMLEARLSPNGEIELHDTEIAPFFVKQRGDGTDSEVSTSLVWIVRESAMDRMVKKVIDSLNSMSL